VVLVPEEAVTSHKPTSLMTRLAFNPNLEHLLDCIIKIGLYHKKGAP